MIGFAKIVLDFLSEIKNFLILSKLNKDLVWFRKVSLVTIQVRPVASNAQIELLIFLLNANLLVNTDEAILATIEIESFNKLVVI